MLLACSNEDVPVPEEDMAIPGASSVTVADLDGTWRCAKTDNENFIPKGFHMTIQNGTCPLSPHPTRPPMRLVRASRARLFACFGGDQKWV